MILAFEAPVRRFVPVSSTSYRRIELRQPHRCIALANGQAVYNSTREKAYALGVGLGRLHPARRARLSARTAGGSRRAPRSRPRCQ
eukprot:6213084-Pleurochrysis_carterae.AAC.2